MIHLRVFYNTPIPLLMLLLLLLLSSSSLVEMDIYTYSVDTCCTDYMCKGGRKHHSLVVQVIQKIIK